ncbi:hypothetical protein HPG69_006271, partial [Diceros bicornis minor]
SPKPPVAPKPKTASPLTAGTETPIAPKPGLTSPNKWRASMCMINSLNKCSSGKLLHNVEEEDCARDAAAEEQFTIEEEGKLVEEHMFSLEDKGPRDGEAVFLSDIILTHVSLEDPAAPEEEPGPPGTPREAEKNGEEGCASAEPGAPDAQEMDSDAEGGLVPVDRKNILMRARPHSGKVAGCVPETDLEETGPEADLSAVGIGGAKELEASGLDDHRIKRKDDNLSLPRMIGSSGSFSQRNRLLSSGTSTPSSMVDIPPPFDLACVTKKPITKSSPSLLIESEPPDQHTKKSSFKRFLALTFKKKSESKVHVDVGVSSRSSSESGHQGPSRLLEVDHRSLSSSPQLKAQTGKLWAPESPSSLILFGDGKRKGVPFGRTVSRVESFEDSSRPPFLPSPLTKPGSISFPNADTSDYENIRAINSDYENIQIPPWRHQVLKIKVKGHKPSSQVEEEILRQCRPRAATAVQVLKSSTKSSVRPSLPLLSPQNPSSLRMQSRFRRSASPREGNLAYLSQPQAVLQQQM